MERIQVLGHQLLILWVVVVGLAFMVRGPRGGWAMVQWPFVIAFRFLRWAVGGLLVSIGRWIRGGRQQRQGGQQRH